MQEARKLSRIAQVLVCEGCNHQRSSKAQEGPHKQPLRPIGSVYWHIFLRDDQLAAFLHISGFWASIFCTSRGLVFVYKIMKEFAIIQTGGKQYLVEEGSTLKIEKLAGEHKVGDTVAFGDVLLSDNGKDATTVGAPFIKGAKVE